MGLSESLPGSSSAVLERSDYQQQLEYLLRRFGDRVLYLAYSYLHDRYLAEDLAQEVFIRVYTNLANFQGRSSLYTWIYHITVNLCRDYLRARGRRHLDPEKFPEVAVTDVEAMALANLEYQDLWRAILQLPVAYREVIWLHYYEQLSLKVDEPTLGIDPQGVRELLDLIVRLARQRGKTILISSHLLHQVQQICDRVGIFVGGRLLAMGPVALLGQQVMAGKPLEIELQAEPDTDALLAALEALPGVAAVERRGALIKVGCQTGVDIRHELTSYLACKGFTLLYLRARGYDLDDIYRQYFQGEAVMSAATG